MDLVMEWLIVMLIALLLLFVIIRLFRRKRRSRQHTVPQMVLSNAEEAGEAINEDELQFALVKLEDNDEDKEDYQETVNQNTTDSSAREKPPNNPTSIEEQDTSLLVSKQIINHCIRFFASEPKLYHEAQCNAAVAVFPPTRKRGWWTYVTVGLHMELQVELIFYSYKEEEEIIENLIQLAKDCRNGVMLTPGQSLRMTKPIISGSALRYALATAPLFESDGFEYYTNGTDVVRMLMLHPIAETEAEFLNTYGFSALEELFIKQEVDSLDFYRRSSAEK